MTSDVGMKIPRDITGEEIEVFADLKYNPSDRLIAKAAEDHKWLRL